MNYCNWFNCGRLAAGESQVACFFHRLMILPAEHDKLALAHQQRDRGEITAEAHESIVDAIRIRVQGRAAL